jgi:hypothetical protein
MKKIIFAFLLGTISLSLVAQTPFDALRFSMLGFGGTARSMGAGGAFGAIGADFSSLSTNPAGIGLYRSSEFTFSPSLYQSIAEATYNDMSAEDDKYNFNVSNLGVVFALGNDQKTSSKWKKVQMGFGYNRLANYNSNVAIEGDNPWNSMVTELQAQATGFHPNDLNPFSTQLAWDTYLLQDTIRNSNGVLQYTSIIPEGGVRQRKFIESRGAQNEMALSIGSNYNNRFYIGGTVGFPTINYKEKSTYQEFDSGDSIPGFTSFSVYDYLNTTGSGVNFKLGIIGRPFDWVRIGAALHTPTFFNMRDEYGRTIKHKRELFTEITANSPDGYFDYQLSTPMRAMVSLGFIIKKYGFIGIDYEFVDYSEAKFEAKSENFFDVNQVINSNYDQASNLRIGGELNLEPVRIRAGYALYGSPYKSGVNHFERSSYTFGLGFKDQNYFIDFAWVVTTYTEDYYLYSPALVNATKIDHMNTAMVMTMGFRF